MVLDADDEITDDVEVLLEAELEMVLDRTSDFLGTDVHEARAVFVVVEETVVATWVV